MLTHNTHNSYSVLTHIHAHIYVYTHTHSWVLREEACEPRERVTEGKTNQLQGDSPCIQKHTHSIPIYPHTTYTATPSHTSPTYIAHTHGSREREYPRVREGAQVVSFILTTPYTPPQPWSSFTNTHPHHSRFTHTHRTKAPWSPRVRKHIHTHPVLGEIYGLREGERTINLYIPTHSHLRYIYSHAHICKLTTARYIYIYTVYTHCCRERRDRGWKRTEHPKK